MITPAVVAMTVLIGAMCWILHCATRPMLVEREVEVEVPTVPADLARLAAHLGWTQTDDADEGTSIARRIAERWDELQQRADGAWGAGRAHGEHVAERQARRERAALTAEWQRRLSDERAVAQAWERRCKALEAGALRHVTHDHASHVFAARASLN